jgi:hypothetical protein
MEALPGLVKLACGLSPVQAFGLIIEYAADRPDGFVTWPRLAARACASPPRPA